MRLPLVAYSASQGFASQTTILMKSAIAYFGPKRRLIAIVTSYRLIIVGFGLGVDVKRPIIITLLYIFHPPTYLGILVKIQSYAICNFFKNNINLDEIIKPSCLLISHDGHIP